MTHDLWLQKVHAESCRKMAQILSNLGHCPRGLCDRAQDENATCHDCIREYYEDEARKEVAPF